MTKDFISTNLQPVKIDFLWQMFLQLELYYKITRSVCKEGVLCTLKILCSYIYRSCKSKQVICQLFLNLPLRIALPVIWQPRLCVTGFPYSNGPTVRIILYDHLTLKHTSITGQTTYIMPDLTPV